MSSVETLKVEIPVSATLPLSDAYQSAFIGHLIQDPKIFMQVGHRVQPDWFVNPYDEKLYKIIQSISHPLGRPPTQSELTGSREWVIEGSDTAQRLTARLNIALQRTADIRWDKIRLELTAWLQSKVLQNAILKTSNLWNRQRWSEVAAVMEDAVKQFGVASFEEGREVSFLNPEVYLQQKYDDVKAALSTGLPLLDEALLDGAVEREQNADEKAKGLPGTGRIIKTTGGLQRGDTTVVLAPSNVGKCWGKGTEILMFSGHRVPVEDIKSGDLLMGPDGAPRKVLSTTKGHGPLFKIIPKTGGNPWICNDVHILSLKCSADDEPKERQRGRYSSTSGNGEPCLWKGDIVNIPLNEYLEKSNNWKNRMKLWRVGLDFQQQNQPIPAYVLGMWLGDGHSSGAVLTTMDDELALTWESWIRSCGHGISVVGNSHNRAWLIRAIGSGTAHSSLRGLDLLGCKHIPHLYLTGSRQQRLELLAGIVDTDGWAGDKVIEITQKSKRLAADIAFLARSLGLKVGERLITKSDQNGTEGQYVSLSLSGALSEIPVRLERKRAKDGSKPCDTSGFRVEPCGEGDYYGFTLDGDRLCLLGDLTVTHNTTFLLTVARHNIMNGNSVLLMTHEGRPHDIRNKLLKACLKGSEEDLFRLYKTPEGVQLLNHVANIIAKNCVYIPYNKAGMAVEEIMPIIRRVQDERKARTGKGFDLLVSDYPAKLTTNQALAGKGALAMRSIIEIVYEHYVQLALECDFHALLAIQTNREGSKVNRGDTTHRLLRMEDVLEAWGPMTAASNVITLNRSPVAQVNKRITLYVAKSRSAEVGRAIVSRTNFKHGLTHGEDLDGLLPNTGYMGEDTIEGPIENYLKPDSSYNGKIIEPNLVMTMMK